MGIESIIALTAVVISIASLLFSVFYSRKTMRIALKHNQLSLLPVITTHYKTLSNKENFESLDLENKGIGPAILKSVTFVYNGKNFHRISNLYRNHYPELFEKLDVSRSFDKTGLHRFALGVNDRIRIYEMHFESQLDTKVLENLHNNVIIEVNYNSVYNQSLVFRVPIISPANQE